MEAVTCLSGLQQGKQLSTQMLLAEKCSNCKAETSAIQTAVAYTEEIKPRKTVILTDSKAALQSIISNTPDQPIHQLLKNMQLIPHECTVVLQWIPAYCGIPGSKRGDRLAKSGTNNSNSCPSPLTRKPKSCSKTDKNGNGKEPLKTTTPLLTFSTVWQVMSRPPYSGYDRDTGLSLSATEAIWHH